MFLHYKPEYLVKYNAYRSHYNNMILAYTALLGAYSYKTMDLYIREPNPYFLLFSGYFMCLLSLWDCQKLKFMDL